jgi:Zn-dependent alcohol dehydrogenase
MKAAVQTAINAPLEILDVEQEGPRRGEVRAGSVARGVVMFD